MRFSEWFKAGQAWNSKGSDKLPLVDTIIAELRQFQGVEAQFKKIEFATGVPVATMHKYLVDDEKTVLL